jgi:K+-sensing histidine kinase KdpD
VIEHPPSPSTPSTDLETARRLATAELVLEIATAAAGELDLDEILRGAISRLASVLSFTGGSIALVDGDELVIRAAVGLFAEEALGHRLARGSSLSWKIVQTLEPERIDDLRAANLTMTGKGATEAVRSWLGVPIARGQEGIGLLEVDSTDVAAFTDEDTALLATVAKALAGPIDLAARYEAERRGRAVRDAFSGMVSHELRTPITTIYGMSQVLRQRHAAMPDDQRQQLIDDIEGEADRLRRLVEDLLILGRSEGGRFDLEREPIVLGHVLRRAIADESRRWPAHQFVSSVPAGLPIVLGEEVYIEQVVRNLLSNAAKYSDATTTIWLTAAAAADHVEVVVADEGIGLPPGDAERLFDLYFRSPEAQRQAGGAGIGLFVCRELLGAMGGHITARPRSPRGAEFVFTLPVAADPDR